MRTKNAFSDERGLERHCDLWLARKASRQLSAARVTERERDLDVDGRELGHNWFRHVGNAHSCKLVLCVYV